MNAFRHILFLFTVSSFTLCFSQDTTELRKVKVYTSLQEAFKNPDKVYALDLSGQKLKELPKDIEKLKNLEILWLGKGLRNLWLYPPAWPYKLHISHLPAGGYAHLDGRGGGHFYFKNYLKSLPEEILNLKKLLVIDIRDNDISLETWVPKLREINPEIIIVSYKYENWNLVEKEMRNADSLMGKYKFK